MRLKPTSGGALPLKYTYGHHGPKQRSRRLPISKGNRTCLSPKRLARSEHPLSAQQPVRTDHQSACCNEDEKAKTTGNMSVAVIASRPRKATTS